jgi:methionine aminopeptidase
MGKREPAAKTCQITRKTVSEAFLKAISQVWETCFSEKQLKDLWLKEMRKSKSLFPSGWYIPPPDGIGVTIGSESNPKRLSYTSLRSQENWPQEDIVFNPKAGLLFAYASPVNKITGIAGDFGITLYAGNNSEIISFFQKVYAINQKIVEMMKPGAKVSDVCKKIYAIFDKMGLNNIAASVTDPAKVNIGHSVPGTLRPYLKKELGVIKSDNWETACKVISERRIFFNEKVNYVFQPGDCFTVEPRLISLQASNLPLILFHMIAKITQNKTKVFENFDSIFKAVRMDYML